MTAEGQEAVAPSAQRRGIWARFQHWATGSPTDPIPTALTVAGCILSACALGWGLTADWRGFALNMSANLALVGPGLFLSNVIVKRIQAARARRRIEPLLRMVLQLLHEAVWTVQQALDMGLQVSLDLPSEPADAADGRATLAALTLQRVDRALSDAGAALPPVEQRPSFPNQLAIQNPLRFPRFSVVLRLIRQMDEAHPMSWAVTSANLADDWGERCGVDFFYYAGDPGSGFGTRDRVVGLTHIAERSVGVLRGTAVGTASYMPVVQQCLTHAEAMINALRHDLPASLRQ